VSTQIRCCSEQKHTIGKISSNRRVFPHSHPYHPEISFPSEQAISTTDHHHINTIRTSSAAKPSLSRLPPPTKCTKSSIHCQTLRIQSPSWGRSGRRGGKPAPVGNPDRPKSKIRNALVLTLRGVCRADGGGGREDVDGAAAAIDRGGNWEFWSITRSSRRFLLLWPRR
jgi:hypothetical protein